MLYDHLDFDGLYHSVLPNRNVCGLSLTSVQRKSRCSVQSFLISPCSYYNLFSSRVNEERKMPMKSQLVGMTTACDGHKCHLGTRMRRGSGRDKLGAREGLNRSSESGVSLPLLVTHLGLQEKYKGWGVLL